MEDKILLVDKCVGGVRANIVDDFQPRGTFSWKLIDCDGETVLNEGEFENTVVTVGKGALLFNGLGGAAYTAANWMGLVSSASFSAIAAADTMTSHAGWLEGGLANAPTYTAPRKVATFGTTTTGTISTGTASFVTTGSGTIQGIFIVGFASATSAIDNTSGILLAAGTLAAAQPVISGNTFQASYTITS